MKWINRISAAVVAAGAWIVSIPFLDLFWWTRAFAFAAVLGLAASPAMAGEGLTPDSFMGGTGLDWITRGDGSEHRVTQLQVAYAYDTGLWGANVDGYSTGGLSASQRILVFPGSEDSGNPADWITELSLEGWQQFFDSSLEVYLGGGLAIWGANIDGQGTELYGPRGGIRWLLDDSTQFEVGYRHYFGPDARRMNGLVFGPRFLIGS